jgi:hypothetical protein
MKLLAFLTNFLLVIAIIGTSLLLVADRTASAKYIASIAQRTNTYQTLSVLLPQKIADQASNGDPVQHAQILKAMQAALTPEYIQGLLTSSLTQFQDVIKANGQEVNINLNEIAVRARASGLDVPDKQFQNVTIPAELIRQPIKVTHIAETTKLALLGATIVLLLLSLYLGYRRGKYTGLGVALIVSGVIEAVFVVGFVVAPDRLLAKVKFDDQIAAFTPLIHRIVNQLVYDLRLEFGIIAGVFIALGILMLVFGRRLPKQKTA